MNYDIDPEPGEDIHAESSGARLEGASNNTTVRINFEVRNGGIWKAVSSHTIERSDSSGNREDGDELGPGKMEALHQCYDAVIADCTYTILLIRESAIDVDYEILLSAMEIGIKAKEQGR